MRAASQWTPRTSEMVGERPRMVELCRHRNSRGVHLHVSFSALERPAVSDRYSSAAV